MIGRLGRSLRVHLLLASQRLEENRLRGLDRHLSYRIGLRTFSASESRAVLGITDAYHLPSAARCGLSEDRCRGSVAVQRHLRLGPLRRAGARRPRRRRRRQPAAGAGRPVHRRAVDDPGSRRAGARIGRLPDRSRAR